MSYKGEDVFNSQFIFCDEEALKWGVDRLRNGISRPESMKMMCYSKSKMGLVMF